MESKENLSKERILERLKSDNVRVVTDALLYATFNLDDWVWVQDECLKLADHHNADIKGLSVTCLGHLSRMHSAIDKDRVIPVLLDKLNDSDIAGRVRDALDDIEMFTALRTER
jgi:hypothetical protein